MNKIVPTEHPYLYLSSLAEARRNHELDMWRESHQHNMACKNAIEAAIRSGFDGMHLDADCAHGVIVEYGFKRVGWVLANTLQKKNYDGRFSQENKEWADSHYIPQCGRNSDFVVESHPAILEGFVRDFRKALAQLQLFDRSHCESMMGRELENKVLVMSPASLKESCWSPQNQLWLAGGGFGCDPNASGRAVYATCLGDGEHTRWNRSDFIGILRDEHLLHVATRLRSYIRKQTKNTPEHFTGMFTRGERIEQEQFDACVTERLENTGRVTGAFDIDLDEGTFDALHIMDGWQCFHIKDISTTAYFANKKTGASWNDRWKVFLERLDGRQITSNTNTDHSME